jgi:hypothetical protein
MLSSDSLETGTGSSNSPPSANESSSPGLIRLTHQNSARSGLHRRRASLVGGRDLREHTVMTSKLPMRPREHEIDEQAVTAFLSQKPASWAAREMSREYGRDLLVTVPAAPGLVGGDDFWVQMKGSEAPNYLADGEHLSHELKVTTLNYLRAQSSPAMLTVCDVGKATKPVYWVWIDDAIRDRRPSEGFVRSRHGVQQSDRRRTRSGSSILDDVPTDAALTKRPDGTRDRPTARRVPKQTCQVY